MNLFNRPILPFFVVAALFDVFLAGCLDAPDYPETARPVESINIMVQQGNNEFTTTLKVNPTDSATIKASVIPEKFQEDLNFEWLHTGNNGDTSLMLGQFYTFYPQRGGSAVPNKLITTDREGNKQIQNFMVVINTPPVLADTTIPANGDTLYGALESAFLFEWMSLDLDLANGDTLFHILEIDSIQYDVGTLLQVKQSGFKPGEHKFRIIVRDLYGDTDTLSYKKFFVFDTLEAK
ncbi:hypothetical protein [Fibrobacter sp. UBA4297]|uniref:hypothetical protein n=1 Tax=Fibrobacter sp. UBA4297 TaxID=1946536 RepID=UPI0025BCC867|nr:hypothetical protein [Fibrobacter sp. UBA4297]